MLVRLFNSSFFLFYCRLVFLYLNIILGKRIFITLHVLATSIEEPFWFYFNNEDKTEMNVKLVVSENNC